MADAKLKKRIQRCLGILTMVLSKKGVNRNTLAQEYGCAIRTIADDIALLREIGFAIQYTHNEYTLSTRDLHIPPLPLKKEHVLSLFIASQLLVLTPLEQKAGEAVNTMLMVLEEQTRLFLRNLTDRVYIAPGGEIGDPQILFDVYRAVSECQSLEIEYDALSTQQTENWTIDPLGIYLKDRERSYLIGHTYYQQPRQYRCFKLCRIRHLTFRNLRFTYPPDFSLRAEMEHGFWTGDQTYDVVIRFQPEVAQLVREREPAERIESLPDGRLLVRRVVRNLDEIFYEVLRYGKCAEVLQPEELRQKIVQELAEWGRMYAGSTIT